MENKENNKSISGTLKGGQALREEKILDFWQENNVFEKSLKKDSPKGNYVFYDGPPFATGLPHYGHILGSTVKDVIGRYQTMQGFRVPRRWGWDCHGLPIENIVEKDLKVSGHNEIEALGVEKFVEHARSKVLTYVHDWKKTVNRIGRWVDFDGSYKTMDNSFIESVWWALGEMNDKGLLYEGVRVLAYCPRCETPIAKSEIAMDNSYKDISDISVYVKMPVVGEENTFFLAWTTTPWSLPGDIVLAVNAEAKYVKAKIENEYFILAKDRTEAVLKDKVYEIVEEFSGEKLVGKKYLPPFDYYMKGQALLDNPKSWTVVSASFVTTTDGTGIAHEAPAFGEDDATLAKEQNIPFIVHVTPEGKFAPEVTDFAGMLIKPKSTEKDGHQKADVEIIKYLAKKNLLFKKEKIMHSYPHCYRCETPLFYYALPSWFINIQKVKNDLLEKSKKMSWIPEHLKEGRFKNTMENAPDWNISRNRYWASPLPFWKSESGKLMFVNSVEDLKAKTKKSGNTYFVMLHGQKEIEISVDEIIYNEYEQKDKENDFIQTLKHAGDFIFNIESKYQNKKIAVVGHSDMARALEFITNGFRLENLKEINETYKDLKNDEIRNLPFIPFPHNANYELDLHRPYIDAITLVDEKGEEYHRIPEVIDCWFESGSMPFAQDHYPFERPNWPKENFPAGFVAEYIAQTRTWFYYTHAISTILFGQAPFEHVVTTGTLLAEDGQKMSKSKNNYPDPWILFDKYGVDPLRLYLMSSPLMKGEDSNFSEKTVQEIASKIIGRLGNVLTFYELYRDEKLETENYVVGDNVLDQWIIARLNQLGSEVTKGMEAYDMTEATRPFDLFVDDLSTWYLRRCRERIKDGEKEAKQTLYFVMKKVAILLAPFAPFTAEDIWLRLKTESCSESVHLAQWPKNEEYNSEILNTMRGAREIVTLGLEARQKSGIKVRQPLASMKVFSVTENVFSDEYKEIIKDELNIKGIIFSKGESVSVELDINITPELKREGDYRDLLRAIQDLRKKQGLTPDDVVSLSLSENAKEIVRGFEDDMKKTVLAKEITFTQNEGEEIEIGDKKIQISVVK